MICDWSCLSNSSATLTTMRIPVVEKTLMRSTVTKLKMREGMNAMSVR